MTPLFIVPGHTNGQWSCLCYSVLSDCLSVVVVCDVIYCVFIVTKRCIQEQKLLLTAYRVIYEKLISSKMNDMTFIFV